jgi:hypothetical protein
MKSKLSAGVVCVIMLSFGMFNFTQALSYSQLYSFYESQQQGQVLGASTVNLVQTKGGSASEATSATAQLSPTSAGDFLVVGIHIVSGTGPLNSITDNLSDAFKQAVMINTDGSAGALTGIYYLSGVSGGITSVTANFPFATSADIVVSEYSGISLTSPLDQTSSFDNGWNGKMPNTSGQTATTAQSSELLWGFFADTYNPQTWTAGSGWTSRITQGESFAEDQVVSKSLGYAATSSIQRSTGYWVAGTVATFIVSGGGSGSNPPTVPTNLSATAVSSSQINLNWTASTDTLAVTGYKVYRNGSLVGSPATNSYSDTGLLPSTTYTYTVSAYDSAGNNSAQSASVQATTQPATQNQLPVINYFTVSPVSIVSGQSATLSWSVATSTNLSVSITVFKTYGNLKPMGTSSVSPTTTRTYILTAANSFGTTTAKTTLTVTPSSSNQAPVISSFAASPSSISQGQSSTLSWSVTGSPTPTVTISPSLGSISGSSVTVSPINSTTYTLTASNSSGSTTAVTTVTVNPNSSQAPVISSFIASPSSISTGQSSTLSWAASGNPAPSLSIDNGIGDVTSLSNDQTSVSPSQSTTYTLTASNSLGSATAQASVTVSSSTTTPPSSPGPSVFFTDVQSGPTSGGPNGLGVPISIFGKGFGATQGTSSYVSIGGVQLPPSDYMIWGQNNSANGILDMIVVQPDPSVKSGAVVVTVNGVSSNANNNFTINNSSSIYYVSTTGKDTNNCSEASPCATVSHVSQDIMKPGDTLLVMGGIYTKDYIWIRQDVTPSESGAPGSQKVIKNYPGQKVSEEKLGDNFIVDASYITVSGIDIPDGNSLEIAGWASTSSTPETGNQFYNNSFEGEGSYAAINITGNNQLIDGNYCDQDGSSQGTEGQCYYVEVGSGSQLRYNVAVDEGGYGMQLHEEPRQVNDYPRTIQNILIEGNVLETSPQRSGLILEVDQCNDYGCYNNAITGVMIRNNIFTANNFTGLEIEQSGTATVSNIQVYNNTFYQNGLQGIYPG